MKNKASPPPARESRSLAKKAGILRAAAELFLEHGYDGVSVDMVIAAVGGTKTNVYKHFGGKAELFAAVVEDLWSESVKPFEDIGQLDAEGLPLEDALRQLGKQFLRAISTEREIKLHRMVVSEAARHPEQARRWFGIGPLAAYKGFASYIEKQQSAGRLIGMPARRLAPLFIDMVSQEMHMSMLIAGAVAPKRSEIDRIVDDAVTVFLHGALSTKAGGRKKSDGSGKAGGLK